jgi:Protein of unknown function (DUF1761)
MAIYPALVAGVIYFMLGGLWFTPLFGKQWDLAVGFNRPPKWRPSLIYYLGPLIGCLIAAFTTAILLQYINPTSLGKALSLGFLVGLGYGSTITTINAISPNMPRPGLYAAVTGSYHLAGIVLCSGIIYALSR